jgi:FMN phosphatase YigB (HAD superfamily)
MIGIGFALAGTLTLEDRAEERAFVELLQALRLRQGLPFDESGARRIADRLFPSDQVEHDARPAALVEAIAGYLGEPVPFGVTVASFRRLAAARAAESVRVAAETRTFLERVASLRIPSAVLTDGWSTPAQLRAGRAGIACPLLVSEEIGAAKPAAIAFDALVKAIALPPDRIWYIGTDPVRDVAGASAAGLRAIWLNREGVSYPPGIAGPSRTIASFDELLPELCEQYTRSLLGLRYVLHSALAWREGHFVPGVEYGLHDTVDLPPLM